MADGLRSGTQGGRRKRGSSSCTPIPPRTWTCHSSCRRRSRTKGYKADSKQFGDLLRKTGGVEIGDVTLDKGYLSRLNTQLIANLGAHPYIALKENTSSALSHGCPAWNNMVHEAWENEEEYEKHYHRRSVVEGVFNAFKERFGREVASKIRHNQNVDILCRVLAWNVLALAYHSNP